MRYLYVGLRDRMGSYYKSDVRSFLVALVGSAEPSYRLKRKDAEAYGRLALETPDRVKNQQIRGMRRLENALKTSKGPRPLPKGFKTVKPGDAMTEQVLHNVQHRGAQMQDQQAVGAGKLEPSRREAEAIEISKDMRSHEESVHGQNRVQAAEAESEAENRKLPPMHNASP